MDFGMFLLLQSPEMARSSEVYARGLELVQAAEDLGLRNVWLAEHHFSNYSHLSRPATFAAYAAARTHRIRLGFAVIALPLHHPLTVAEDLATLDVLSGGRVDVGLGRGYWRYVFDRLGIDKRDDRDRFDEALDVLLRALEGTSFEYRGAHFDIGRTRIFPQPEQDRMPVWIAAQSAASVEDAVRRGLNVLSGGTLPIRSLAAVRAHYDALIARYEHAPQCRFATQRWVYVTDSHRDARAVAERARWNIRVSLTQRRDTGSVDHDGTAEAAALPEEPSLYEMLAEHMVVGTPQVCIAQLRRIEGALAPDHVNASFWFGDLDQRRILRSLELFATEVMPAFDAA